MSSEMVSDSKVFEAYETIKHCADTLGVTPIFAFKCIESEYTRKEYEARKKEESTDDRN